MVELDSNFLAESIRPDGFFLPNQTGQLFTIGAALEKLGPGSRVRTQVHSTAHPAANKLTGNLVLVGSGDLNLGGRGAGRGPIEYSDFDHDDEVALEKQTMAHNDPLFGLNYLAREVYKSGIETIEGDVLVDDVVFEPYEGWQGGLVSPVVLNDNLIDLLITPTLPGSAAATFQQPIVTGYEIDSRITTSAPGGQTKISIKRRTDGRIEATGTVPANSRPVLRKFVVENPAEFARSAFIDALRRAGVVVNISRGTHPAPEQYVMKVAELESASLADEIKVIAKSGLNSGANLLTCRLAVSAGSKQCPDGIRVIQDVLGDAGIRPDETNLFDGAGSHEHSRTTPAALIKWLSYAGKRPWSEAFLEALPLMGVDGSLVDVERSGYAMGKVRAMSGSRTTTTLDGGKFLLGYSVAGYLESRSGKAHVFALAVNDVPLGNEEDRGEISNDLGAIVSALRQAY